MWNIDFEHQYDQRSGATGEQMARFVKEWNAELSAAEIVDIAGWKLPQRSFPASYLDLLKYSNGGEFQQGERLFQFFNTDDLREMSLAYELPEYMPNAVSFAMDGSGNHYMFDMREEPINGEYPILFAHSGSLGYEESERVANSLPALCTEKWELY